MPRRPPSGRRRRTAARALAWGDRLSKIAFLYGIESARWPRALDPARGLLLGPPDAGASAGGGRVVSPRSRARARNARGCRERRPDARVANAVDRADRRRSLRAGGALRAARFAVDGTGGVLLRARPRGARGNGGRRACRRTRRLHRPRPSGSRAAPLAVRDSRRHLPRAGPRDALRPSRSRRAAPRRLREARAAARRRREDGLGPSPRVHYELWRLEGGRLRPTDPLFAILDGRLDDRHRSLEQMRATSAPGPGTLCRACPEAATARRGAVSAGIGRRGRGGRRGGPARPRGGRRPSAPGAPRRARRRASPPR